MYCVVVPCCCRQAEVWLECEERYEAKFSFEKEIHNNKSATSEADPDRYVCHDDLSYRSCLANITIYIYIYIYIYI